ncbi:SRPBCC family protein [Streptomyces sp. t39]|uniref:SRPBCC family protein n=1 Tax=Streptomyces sp. t39 TaxID=1828156 RepID=UPI0011CE1E3E|nr:SRPBCC family protein [Streptomyces sp. t39]TXS52465.1 SRPBCC family protein [Streptomyces sp. t39]
MALRHRLVHRTPRQVWDVLSDGDRFGEWVVGTTRSAEQDGDWPAEGARLAYTVRIGPWEADGRTVVRVSEPPHRLELEAYSGPLGTARIAFELRPWGDDTLVLFDEHPLRGPGGALHNAAFDAVQQLRHRALLRRFAETVESSTVPERH